MKLSEWVEISEIAKNLVGALALLGAAWAVLVWLYQRRDRAADVLLQLEERFNQRDLVQARAQLEDAARYESLAARMERSVDAKLNGRQIEGEDADKLRDIDHLLRFYVLLLGIRRARQVPDASLRTCYRYWLGLSLDHRYKSFRRYVDEYFVTLSQWLSDDARQSKSNRFFDHE